MIDCQYFSPIRNQGFEFIDAKVSILGNRQYLHRGMLPLAQHLPGHDVGMMLGLGNDNLIALVHESLSEGKGDQVDGMGYAGGKDDLAAVRRMQEIPHSIPRFFVSLRGFSGYQMHGPVQVGIADGRQLHPPVQYRLRALDRRCIVEINQRLSIHLTGKDGKLGSDIFDGHKGLAIDGQI